MAITLDGSNVNTVGLINTQTAKASTSGTSVDFTGIPSGVKRVTIMFYGVSSAGTSNWLVRLGTSSGFVTTGYLCGASYAGGVNTTGGANSTAGFLLQIGGVAQTHGSMILSLVDASTYKWVQQCSVGDSSQAYVFFSGGSVALSGVLTQVRLTTVNGTDTFDAGSMNILYE